MTALDFDVIGGLTLAAAGFTTIAAFMARAAIQELHQRHTRKKGPTR